MMKQPLNPPCRLYALFAREADVAVIFRRGPTKWTQVIAWDTKADTLTYGQWFKGRIYEKRCDLSPDGSKLIYFAAKYYRPSLRSTAYTETWTAVSRPPYLTALALWPKGDAWHGGGLFRDERTIFLNHRPDSVAPHPSHVPPKHVRVIDNLQASGEDEPIYSMRLDRDGWRLHQQWKVSWNNDPIFFRTEQPDIRIRRQPRGSCHLKMVRSVTGFTYSEQFMVETLDGASVLDLPAGAWANWDHRGRLVVLHEGKVLVGREVIAGQSFELRELVDLNDRRPEELISPAWARKW